MSLFTQKVQIVSYADMQSPRDVKRAMHVPEGKVIFAAVPSPCISEGKLYQLVQLIT